jgi:hypothetical protein
MDILNWLYLAKNKFVRTTPSSDKDLMVFGAKVGTTKRGDLYQNYAMSIEDFAAQIAPPPVNIYNSDGALTNTRLISGVGNYDLIFQNIPNFTIASTQNMQIQCAYKQVNLGTNSGNLTLLKLDDNAVFPVQISGTNVSANVAGLASGQFLKIKVNGVDYKIALLNP